jgi:hypothetical protein
MDASQNLQVLVYLSGVYIGRTSGNQDIGVDITIINTYSNGFDY